jgi:hypothetical protein
LTIIPKILHEHINNSYPAHVCLIGTVLPNGYAQITPRGSTMVFDDEHFSPAAVETYLESQRLEQRP